MRLSAICSEAWRNLTCGTSKLAVMVMTIFLLGLVTGGYEAVTICSLETQAQTRVQADADVKILLGKNVDGPTCERLSQASGGPSSSGALRKGPQVTPLATSGMDLASFEVTSGLLQVLSAGSSQPVDPAGVWVSRDLAHDFGLSLGSVMPTDHGQVKVAGIFNWPNDGRDTRLAYALVTPVSSSDGGFQECWAKQWPQSSDTDSLLKMAQPVGGDDAAESGITQLNKGFDSHYDAAGSYQSRLTRWMPYVALLVGLLVGLWSVLRRRLEYAGALHIGEDKGSQLLTIGIETLVWLALGTLATAGVLLAICYAQAPSDPGSVTLTSMRSPLALAAGTLIGAFAAGLSIRQSQLFHYFKNR